MSRLAAGGGWETIDLTPTEYGNFSDKTVSANKSYLYRCRAIAPEVTPYSEPSLSTTVIFTFIRHLPAHEIVKAVHLRELRTAVNAVRSLAGLPKASLTDPVLEAGSTLIKAAHVTELRDAVDEARSVLQLREYTWSRAVIAGQSQIMLWDISELHWATAGGERSSPGF